MANVTRRDLLKTAATAALATRSAGAVANAAVTQALEKANNLRSIQWARANLQM